jgi:hypothetical protein
MKSPSDFLKNNMHVQKTIFLFLCVSRKYFSCFWIDLIRQLFPLVVLFKYLRTVRLALGSDFLFVHHVRRCDSWEPLTAESSFNWFNRESLYSVQYINSIQGMSVFHIVVHIAVLKDFNNCAVNLWFEAWPTYHKGTANWFGIHNANVDESIHRATEEIKYSWHLTTLPNWS